MKLHLLSLAELTHLFRFDHAWNKESSLQVGMKQIGKIKEVIFVERFWHYDVITSMSEQEFTEEYILWAKEKKYVQARKSQSYIHPGSGKYSHITFRNLIGQNTGD